MMIQGQNKRGLTIGMLINQIDGMYQSPLWKGLERFAEEHSVNLFFFAGKSLNSPISDEKYHNFIYQLPSLKIVDGLIVSTSSITNFQDYDPAFLANLKDIPMVSISQPVEGVPSIVIDSKSAMKSVINHLISVHGLRKIAFIKGPKGLEDTNERYEAYVEALQENGIGYDPGWVYQGNFQTEAGVLAVREWIQEKKKIPEAIVASNDEMALGAFQELTSLGIKVPEDIRLTGFDDIDQAKYMQPSLTTVMQPIFELAYRAGELLLDKLKGADIPLINMMPSEPVFRESCGCRIRSLSSERQWKVAIEDIEKEHYDITSLMKGLKFQPSDRKYFEGIFERLVQALQNDLRSQGEAVQYTKLMEIILNEVNYDSENLSFWKNGLHKLNEAILDRIIDMRELALAEEIVYKAELFFMDMLLNKENERFIEHAHLLWKLRDILRQFSSSVTPDKLFDNIESYFPSLGIKSVYITMFKESLEQPNLNTVLPRESSFAMGYCLPEGPLGKLRGHLFPTSELLPQNSLPIGRRFSLFVFPLFSKTSAIGLFMCEYGTNIEITYGILREQITNAINICGLINHLEETEGRMANVMGELQKSEERFREMAFFLPTIILETDLSLQVVYMNQAGIGLFAIPSDASVQGLSLLQFIHPEDRDKFKEQFSKFIYGDLPDLNEYRLIRLDGQEISVLSRATLSQRGGKIEGIRWSAIDVKPLLASVVKPDREFFDNYHFSPRERDVIELLLQGYKLREIADKLFISLKTVKAHITSIYTRMDVSSREEFFDVVKNYLAARFGHTSFKFSILNQLLRE